MELVAMELKQSGLFLARTLSYEVRAAPLSKRMSCARSCSPSIIRDYCGP